MTHIFKVIVAEAFEGNKVGSSSECICCNIFGKDLFTKDHQCVNYQREKNRRRCADYQNRIVSSSYNAPGIIKNARYHPTSANLQR